MKITVYTIDNEEGELIDVKMFDYMTAGIFQNELRVIFKDGTKKIYYKVKRVIVEE